MTSTTPICKTAIVAQEGSVVILPFLMNHMALISAGITENIISQMLLHYNTIIVFLAIMIVIGLAALDSNGLTC